MSDYGSLAPNPVLAGRQPSSSYETQLNPLDEMAFRQWVKDNNVPFNPDASASQDYDMRGFYQGMIQGNPKAKFRPDPNDGKIHYNDFWKTPLHETFSNESQWAPADAPRWTPDDKLVTPGGRIVFDDRQKATLAKLIMGDR